MNVGLFVASESDVADLATAFCASSTASSAPQVAKMRSGSVSRIYLVELEEIDSVSSRRRRRRVVDLIASGGLGASVDLGHKKSLLAVTITQRVAHADFTLAAVVIPAVVEKIDALIETRANDANAFLRICLFAEMIATKANERDSLSTAAQRSIKNVIFGFRSRRLTLAACANKMDAAANPRNPRREMPASSWLLLETDARYESGEFSWLGWFFLLSTKNLFFKRP